VTRIPVLLHPANAVWRRAAGGIASKLKRSRVSTVNDGPWHLTERLMICLEMTCWRPRKVTAQRPTTTTERAGTRSHVHLSAPNTHRFIIGG
jgi:hypothetical protein